VRSCRRRFLDGEDGLGLIEVMIAIFVLGVALSALASVALSTLSSLRLTRDREQATNLASAAIEEVRARDYAGVAMGAGTVDVGALPPGSLGDPFSSDTCIDGEPVVVDVVSSPVPFERQVGDAFTVHTLVTWADEDCPTAVGELKRIIAIASWEDRGIAHQVRQETLVARAGRGLPVPKFEIRPPAAELTLWHYALDNDDDPVTCSEHNLRTLGADDSYDYDVADATVTTTGVPAIVHPTNDGFYVGDWELAVYLIPRDDWNDDELDADPRPDESHRLVRDAAERPSSDLRVASGETARLTICYSPRPDLNDDDDDEKTYPADIATTLTVHSRFDERQQREVASLVEVKDQSAAGGDECGPGTGVGTPLFLFDHNDATAHPRDDSQPYLMGASSCDPLRIEHLSTHDYDPSESNWSTNIGSGNIPGTRLQRPVSAVAQPALSGHTAAWHRQFSQRTRFLSSMELHLWHAPVNGFIAHGTLPSTGQPVRLDIHVDVLRKNESGVVNNSHAVTTYQYDHTTQGFAKLVIPLTVPELTINADYYLRLRVHCASTNTQDCNLAYDNVNFPSALYVQER
jgi:hypothetical protein